tara:strand:- start:66 stop:626 length:561 start_codon:yes stop_codon:yes gene_type:complete
MAELISLVASCCCGIFILIGLIAVFFGGSGMVIGGVTLAVDSPKAVLYFLYFASIFLGITALLETYGLIEPLYSDVESQKITLNTMELFFGYSIGVLVFHLMAYEWNRLGLGELEEPPKWRWAIAGVYISVAIWMIIVMIVFGDVFSIRSNGDEEFFWVFAGSLIIGGPLLAYGLIFWAKSELKNK